jgi:1,4-dihydroxy-2-naphthoate octaprenyltransferase
MINKFLQYVEIRTKLASVLPFLLGLAYAWLAFAKINWLNTGLFFLSMICFDMATTALNNYTDSRTNGVPLQFPRRKALGILLVLLALAVLFGLLLAWQAGWVLLAAGALCFLIGILYTFGPAPISRMPLGELFSGVFMGFFIPFLTILANASRAALITFTLVNWQLQLTFDLVDLAKIVLLTVAPICGIANIMLANNICDVEHDRQVDRFTLPYYIGLAWALRLFAGLYYLGFLAIAALVILQILPIYGLVPLLTLPLVQRNLRQFHAVQSKPATFPLSVQNFVIMMIPLIIVTALAAI